MYKFIIPFLILINLAGCNIENPAITAYSEEEIQNANPFLIFDDEGNTLIFYGQDTVSMSGYGKTDSEFDLLMLKKFDENGNILLGETNILKTNAIIDYAVLKKDNLFYVIWLDPRNNANFVVNHLHTYDVDIYYKIIDDQGRIITDDTRLTGELIDYKDACSNYILEGIHDSTLASIKSSEHFAIDGSTCFPNKTWIIIDKYDYEYHFKSYGNHISDSCKITYMKLNRDSVITLNETTIAGFSRASGNQWGPEIQNLFFEYNDPNTISMCWQLNDGRNHFHYYYAIINTISDSIVCIKVGVKYPLST
ncbi:MAG: hypothetical protein PHX07_06245 [Candidatus Marinimicrobia bacterium]|nr:hypothetical protein [Candidatus Neomarinimicrobiota bacterium]MDD5710098.1 hypothetical protein [Candidatus Neomarinimicrobiota bacterium]